MPWREQFLAVLWSGVAAGFVSPPAGPNSAAARCRGELAWVRQVAAPSLRPMEGQGGHRRRKVGARAASGRNETLTEEGQWMATIRGRDVFEALAAMREDGAAMTPRIYHVAMTELRNNGRADEALELFAMLRSDAAISGGCEPDKFCYDAAISAARALGQRDVGFALLNEMRARGFTPSSYTFRELLESCRGSLGGLERAEALLADVLDGAAAAAAAESATQRGDSKAVFKIRKAVGLSKTILQLLADEAEVAFTQAGGRTGGSAAIAAISGPGSALEAQWHRALALLRAMQHASVWPDTECFNSVIRVGRRAGQYRQVADLLQELRATGIAHRKVKPDGRTFSDAILSCLESGGDVNDALAMLRQFREARPQITRDQLAEMYKALIDACARERMLHNRALELFQEMREARVRPTGGTYRTVIALMARRGAAADADAALTEARTSGRRLTVVTHNQVIGLLGKAGNLDRAMEVFRAMWQDGLKPTIQTYNTLINGCEKAGDWMQALSLLDEMRSKGVPPDTYTFASAISACGKGGNPDRSLSLLACMRSEGVEPNLHCYNAAINAARLAQRWEKASAMLDVMIRERISPDAYTFNTVISACADAGKYEQCTALLGLMRSEGVPEDEYTYAALMQACSRGQGKGNGDPLNAALALLDDMRAVGVRPNAVIYTTLIAACAQACRPDVAASLLGQMEREGTPGNVRTYSAAISAAEKSQDVAKAFEFYGMMQRKHIAPDEITYCALLSACGHAGQWEQAVGLLDEMKSAKIGPSMPTYTAAMRACEKGEQYVMVMQLFDRMRRDKLQPDLSVYQMAIGACERSNQWNRALLLLQEMQRDGLSPNW